MRLDAGWSDFTSDGRTARPSGAARGDRRRLPGVLLIQEIWGVDEHIQDLAGCVATAGSRRWRPTCIRWAAGRRRCSRRV